MKTIIKEYELEEDINGELCIFGDLLNEYEIEDDLTLFVYDGCHKIYILEDMNDYKKVCDVWGEGEPIYGLEDLEDCYNNSCPLRFISNWKLDVYYVKQCEYAIFEWK